MKTAIRIAAALAFIDAAVRDNPKTFAAVVHDTIYADFSVIPKPTHTHPLNPGRHKKKRR